jgi:hypothetical protein
MCPCSASTFPPWVLLTHGRWAYILLAHLRTLAVDAVGGLLPDQKAKWVSELRGKNRKVAMFGDGIHDAPVGGDVALPFHLWQRQIKPS